MQLKAQQLKFETDRLKIMICVASSSLDVLKNTFTRIKVLNHALKMHGLNICLKYFSSI